MHSEAGFSSTLVGRVFSKYERTEFWKLLFMDTITSVDLESNYSAANLSAEILLPVKQWIGAIENILLSKLVSVNLNKCM